MNLNPTKDLQSISQDMAIRESFYTRDGPHDTRANPPNRTIRTNTKHINYDLSKAYQASKLRSK